jgi:hypothetical protein
MSTLIESPFSNDWVFLDESVAGTCEQLYEEFENSNPFEELLKDLRACASCRQKQKEVGTLDYDLCCYLQNAVYLPTSTLLELLDASVFSFVNCYLPQSISVLSKMCLSALDSLCRRTIHIGDEETLFKILKSHPIFSGKRKMEALFHAKAECEANPFTIVDDATYAWYDQNCVDIFSATFIEGEKKEILSFFSSAIAKEKKHFPLSINAFRQEYQKMFENCLLGYLKGDSFAFTDFPILNPTFSLVARIENTQLDDDQLKKLLKMPLQTVEFVQCAEVSFCDFDSDEDGEASEPAFSYIACPVVQKLSFIGCPKVNPGSLLAILANFPCLISCDIQNCPQVTEQDIATFNEELQRRIM